MKFKITLLISVLVGLVFLDQLTKFLITDHLIYGQVIEIIPSYFNLTYAKNPGAAFGIFSKIEDSFRVPFFILMPLIALLLIGFVYFQSANRLQQTSLALVMAGATGNLIDRIRFGYVVDFLDFHWQHKGHFPSFNVADSAITIGVTLLFIEMFFNKSSAERVRK